MMVGRENGDKDEPSAGSAENKIPIYRACWVSTFFTLAFFPLSGYAQNK
jgi:hypothetical protein